jgi:anti-anti-sigma factor
MSHTTPQAVIRRETAHKYLTVRQLRHRHDIERVQPIGEIDLCTAPILRDVLADADRRAVPTVLVDLSEVGFLALIGVQVLQTAAERTAQGNRRLALVAPTPMVQRVLSLTDTTGALEIYASMSNALSALAIKPIELPVTPAPRTAPAP